MNSQIASRENIRKAYQILSENQVPLTTTQINAFYRTEKTHSIIRMAPINLDVMLAEYQRRIEEQYAGTPIDDSYYVSFGGAMITITRLGVSVMDEFDPYSVDCFHLFRAARGGLIESMLELDEQSKESKKTGLVKFSSLVGKLFINSQRFAEWENDVKRFMQPKGLQSLNAIEDCLRVASERDIDLDDIESRVLAISKGENGGIAINYTPEVVKTLFKYLPKREAFYQKVLEYGDRYCTDEAGKQNLRKHISKDYQQATGQPAPGYRGVNDKPQTESYRLIEP